MALSANTVLEVRQAGSDTNGGGFVAGASGTDWSQQSAAQYAVTDGVTAGTTTITSASAAFGIDVVGNTMYVQGGTGSVVAGWYQIVSRTSATAVVVDRSTGLTAGTGVTLNIGGALASPGQAAAIMAVTGMKTWVKYSASVYAIATTTAGSGGPASLTSAVGCSVEGYEVTRGDRTGNRPTLQWQTAPGSVTYACTAAGSARQAFLNLRVDGNSENNAAGFNVSPPRVTATDCVAANCNGTGAVIGFLGGSLGMAIVRCQASACTTGFSACNAADCDAVSCVTGYGGAYTLLAKCLARACTNGFQNNFGTSVHYACTADSNTTAGFDTSGSQGAFVACIASNHAAGIGFKVATNAATFLDCASYNNATEVSGTALVNEGMIYNASFTGGQPYMTAGSDFRPNATAGAGALLRGAGVGVFGQADNQDIGAVQHSDPSATTYVINKMINNYYYDSPEP